MSRSFHVESSTEVFSSFVFDVERRVVSDGTQTFERDVVTHAGAVAVLAVDENGRVGILRQYRATFDDVNWELPAGTRDIDGESPIDTARRELMEEMGVRAERVTELFRYMNSRGWTDQTTNVYLATELHSVDRRQDGPEELASEVHWLTRDEILELLSRRDLMEASTLLALNWYVTSYVP